MRDAIGGSMTLVVIVVFLVIALGYMAFNVNYTKAFRMKDKIITIYEKYDGKCESACKKEIDDYAKKIAYNAGTQLKCPDGTTAVGQIYCAGTVKVNNNKSASSSVNDEKEKYYYKIVTKINVEIPIINNVLNLQFFYIKGDTKTFSK